MAVASGGVWKTTNAGNTYTPIFDGQSLFSIGCVTIDLVMNTRYGLGQVKIITKEVAYGDGIYRSLDGGKENMGLKESEHIGMIAVHPTNSNIIYAAAYGPLWKEGGERGLYKSTNAGKNWELILEVDEHTGVNEIHLDPRNADIMYATTHQRRRHVFTYVGGGLDLKFTNRQMEVRIGKLKGGLPSSIKGIEGYSAKPDVLYALVEAEMDKQGLYKSTDMGESWKS